MPIVQLEVFFGDFATVELRNEVAAFVLKLVGIADSDRGDLAAALWINLIPGFVDDVLSSLAEPLGQSVDEFLVANESIAVSVEVLVQVLQVDHLWEDATEITVTLIDA